MEAELYHDEGEEGRRAFRRMIRPVQPFSNGVESGNRKNWFAIKHVGLIDMSRRRDFDSEPDVALDEIHFGKRRIGWLGHMDQEFSRRFGIEFRNLRGRDGCRRQPNIRACQHEGK